jgi:alanine-synthesizing transaminase
MFSRRADWRAPVNALTLAIREHRGPLFDLTESNPTRAGLDYPLDELSEVMGRAARAAYSPEPLGLRPTREAVAVELGAEPDDIMITASTSEAYSFLFKLLTDPGDNVAAATPGYPLFEHLAALEQIELHPFALERQRRWELHPAVLRDVVDACTRAVIVVHPNNPTGSYLRPEEQDAVASVALAQGAALISDEVFYDFPLDENVVRALPAGRRTDVLSFSLGGLSKSAGLPHYKLGWIHVGGPSAQKREALEALELIADNFLSVGTPVQAALPELLALAPRIREAIRTRTRANLEVLVEGLGASGAAEVLPPEGGWSAVVRVPRTRTDEELALALLRECGVLVHPGYFFDFAQEGFVVVSLLTRPEVFAQGIGRIAQFLC